MNSAYIHKNSPEIFGKSGLPGVSAISSRGRTEENEDEDEQ
jgi:hypothetical protein